MNKTQVERVWTPHRVDVMNEAQIERRAGDLLSSGEKLFDMLEEIRAYPMQLRVY
jgi:hypothetical protein